MKTTKLLEGLQERKAEIQAELASVQPLLDELTEIERMIARYASHSNGSVLRLPFKAPSKRHAFQADPNSRASRVLAETRRILENTPGHELPFLAICERLPKDLVATSRLRQYARMTMQRGKREGIEYLGAERVRLAA